MIILDSVLKTLEVKLAGAVATAQLPIYATYVDVLALTQSVSAIAEQDGTTNNTTPVTALGAPAVGHTRTLKFLAIHNKDTATVTLTVQINNFGTVREVWKGQLMSGETLNYVG